MKRFTFIVGISMLLVAFASQAQTPAPKPGPETQRLVPASYDLILLVKSKVVRRGRSAGGRRPIKTRSVL